MAVFAPVFRALNQGGVRYVVVGGLAVVLHGHPRMTADVDLVVDLDETEAKKAIEVLVAAGLRPRVPVDPGGFADRSVREGWIRDRPSNPLRVVDLFVHHQVPFPDLWSRSQQVDIGGTIVRVASIPGLIHLKRLSGRPLDLDDIEKLEAIQEAKKGGADG